ncbi:MAG: hypothetical protein KJP00_09465 [Bacteroidia bacterium]|nr:hypothetical protein [Bacteroidia bacterium]
MKVEKINDYIAKVKHYLKVNEHDELLYKYECLKNFQDNWDIEAIDFYEMYNNALSSKMSNRLWGGRRNSSKSAMLEMIKTDKHFADAMFRDLLDESKSVGPRMERFIFHAEQLADLASKGKKQPLHHKHANYHILSVYLAFRYPETYCIYEYKNFKECMIKLEILEVPQIFEIGRFFKLAQALNKMLQKDEELLEIHKERINEDIFYQENSLLLVSDFIDLVGGKQYRIEDY